MRLSLHSLTKDGKMKGIVQAEMIEKINLKSYSMKFNKGHS